MSAVLILLMALPRLLPAQTPTPFNCASGLSYILTNPTTNANGNVTSFYSFNLSDGSSTLIKAGILPEPNRFLNAFGYNVIDNFLYGYRYNTNQIVRLGSNGEIQLLTVAGLSTSGSYATGDVSSSGILYLYGSGSVVAVDLNPSSPNYLVAQTRLSGAGANALNGLNDWTISPIDGKIYGMTTAKVLVSYDPATNTVATIGPVSGLDGQSGSFGTAFMDSMGNMYVGNNASGKIYKIPTPNSASLPVTASLFSNSLAGKTPGDGARCPNQIIPPAANDDQACSLPQPATLQINVTANDGAGSFPLNPGSVRLIDPTTGSAVTSVTIAGQGTYTVSTTTGVVTFNPEAGSVTSSITYIIKDTQGGQSGRATLAITPCNLPVTLVSFRAQEAEPAILLTWQTTQEVNFDFFQLERSPDLRTGFASIAVLSPEGDAARGTYSYLDQTTEANRVYYYRLKMVDQDGTYAYSKVVSAQRNLESSLLVYPNPARSNLTVTCDEAISSFRLIDSGGRTVFYRSKFEGNQISLRVQEIPAGIYFLQITTVTGQLKSRKVAIQ